MREEICCVIGPLRQIRAGCYQPCCRTLPFQEGFHIWGNKGQLEGFKSIFLSQMYGLQNILDQKLTNICWPQGTKLQRAFNTAQGLLIFMGDKNINPTIVGYGGCGTPRKLWLYDWLARRAKFVHHIHIIAHVWSKKRDTCSKFGPIEHIKGSSEKISPFRA